MNGEGWTLKGHGDHLLVFKLNIAQIYTASEGELVANVDFEDEIVDAEFNLNGNELRVHA